MMEILPLLFGCLGFTCFCVEAFSYVSGETRVQTSFLTLPLWFFSKAQCQGFLVHPQYLWSFSFLFFTNMPLLLFFVEFILAVSIGLEKRLSLSAVWVYCGILTDASVFGETQRQFVVGSECIKRQGQGSHEVVFDSQNVEK